MDAHRTRLVRMSTAEISHCYRHPDRETGLSCSECGRPICADCATFAPVGIRCPDHAGTRRGPTARVKPPTVRRAPGIALATGNAPVTKALIGINVVIYLVTVLPGRHSRRQQPTGLALRPGSFSGRPSPHGGWWRLVTAMFLHAILLHIGFNMYALWVIGTPVEQYLGTTRYLGLYFVSGLAGSAGALARSRRSRPSLGASGRDLRGPRRDDDPRVAGHGPARRPGGGLGRDQPRSVVRDPGHLVGRHVGGLIGGILIMLSLRALGRQPQSGAVRAARPRWRTRAGTGRRSVASRSRISKCAATPSRRRGSPSPRPGSRCRPDGRAARRASSRRARPSASRTHAPSLGREHALLRAASPRSRRRRAL